ncbi:MAG: DUF1330 domain-containing protein [Burkholderiaceae bacterium]|jgi:uncharacterized protein (DUF1330 family)|nr:DUF1330 domain-containing protein [Burkholderiaceae bacterium]
MPYGYIIVEMKINDLEQYKKYMAVAQEMVKAAGGEYLVRGGRCETVEGEWQPARVGVIRFPSYEAAKTFNEGAAYATARQLRNGTTEYFNMILVEGVAAPV